MLTEEKQAYRAECRRQARERFDREYGGSEAPSPVYPDEPSPRDGLAVERAAHAEWQRNASIRLEFVELERYIAFRKAEAKGLVKIFRGRVA